MWICKTTTHYNLPCNLMQVVLYSDGKKFGKIHRRQKYEDRKRMEKICG